MLFFHSISFAMALWVRKCYFKKTKKTLQIQRKSGVPCLVQVQNPRNRESHRDLGARQTAWEGPGKGTGLGSSANSEQEIDRVVEYLGVLTKILSGLV